MSNSGNCCKKILIVLVDFANGGIESFLYNVLSRVGENNIVIDIVFNRKYSDDTFLEKIAKNVRNVFCYGGALCYSPFFYLPRLFWMIKKYGPYDVIYANAGLLNGFVAFFGYLLGVNKCISHLHTQEKPSSLLQRVKKWICTYLLRHFATVHLAPSATVLNCFTPSLTPYKIIPNGIDTSVFAFNPNIRKDIRCKLKLQDAFLIGHVGRFDKMKNHTFMLQVFSQFHTRYPNSYLLLIGTGPQFQIVQQQVNQLQLSDKVIMLAGIDPKPYYQAMDAFVFPSFQEGFGIVAIEAQCAGLPCFISDGVPAEAIICNTTQIPLAKSAEQWVEIILDNVQYFQRKDCSGQIKKAGYDISETSCQIIEEFLK